MVTQEEFEKWSKAYLEWASQTLVNLKRGSEWEATLLELRKLSGSSREDVINRVESISFSYGQTLRFFKLFQRWPTASEAQYVLWVGWEAFAYIEQWGIKN